MPNSITTAERLGDGSGSWPAAMKSALGGHYKRTAATVADSSNVGESPKYN